MDVSLELVELRFLDGLLDGLFDGLAAGASFFRTIALVGVRVLFSWSIGALRLGDFIGDVAGVVSGSESSSLDESEAGNRFAFDRLTTVVGLSRMEDPLPALDIIRAARSSVSSMQM
jgi:hypothetical protein